MNKKRRNMLVLELGIVLLVLILFILWKGNMIRFIPPCFMYETFGLLCPACGGTRCIINFMSGNFQESFFYHPIFFLTVIYLLLINIIYVVNVLTQKEIATVLYPKGKFWIFFSMVLLLV